MSIVRRLTIVMLGLRVAYGLGLLFAPGRLGRPWVGDAVDGQPTRVPLRGVGAREAGLHAAAIAVALDGGALRPWLAASLVGDLTDLGATVLGRSELPAGAAGKTAAAAGGAAALTALAAVLVDD